MGVVSKNSGLAGARASWPVLLNPSKVCPAQVSEGSPLWRPLGTGGRSTHSLTPSSVLPEHPVASFLVCHRDGILTPPQPCLQPRAGSLIAG